LRASNGEESREKWILKGEQKPRKRLHWKVSHERSARNKRKFWQKALNEVSTRSGLQKEKKFEKRKPRENKKKTWARAFFRPLDKKILSDANRVRSPSPEAVKGGGITRGGGGAWGTRRVHDNYKGFSGKPNTREARRKNHHSHEDLKILVGPENNRPKG